MEAVEVWWGVTASQDDDHRATAESGEGVDDRSFNCQTG